MGASLLHPCKREFFKLTSLLIKKTNIALCWTHQDSVAPLPLKTREGKDALAKPPRMGLRRVFNGRGATLS
jgi:hypothetical protein